MTMLRSLAKIVSIFLLITLSTSIGNHLNAQDGKALFDFLAKANIIVDWREPNVIRIAPAPIYNSYEDVFLLGQAFQHFTTSL